MIDPSTLFDAGVFGKPTGFRGGIVLLTDGQADIVPDMFVFTKADGLPVPWHITEAKTKGSGYVVKIKDVDDSGAVAVFTGQKVYVEEEYINRADDGELLYTDLIGYTLIDRVGEIGTVCDVDDSTENVVFDVAGADGRHFLVPAADDFIVAIDEKERTIEMTLPEGLIDLN